LSFSALLFVELFSQIVIFLFLVDSDTSLLVTIPVSFRALETHLLCLFIVETTTGFSKHLDSSMESAESNGDQFEMEFIWIAEYSFHSMGARCRRRRDEKCRNVRFIENNR